MPLILKQPETYAEAARLCRRLNTALVDIELFLAGRPAVLGNSYLLSSTRFKLGVVREHFYTLQENLDRLAEALPTAEVQS